MNKDDVLAISLFGCEENEKIKRLTQGLLTVPELLSSLTEEDPFHLVQIDDNKFLLKNKRHHFSLEEKVNNEKLKKIRENILLISKIFPELEEQKGCSGCGSLTENKILISNIVKLGGKNRKNIELLIPLLGEWWVKEFSLIEKETKRNEQETLQTRPSCLNCTKKHLASAMIYFKESILGYPQHRWLGIGELEHASAESLQKFPSLSKQIKEEQEKTIKEKEYIPDLLKFFSVIEGIENGQDKTTN